MKALKEFTSNPVHVNKWNEFLESETGKLFRQVVEEQNPVMLASKPELQNREGMLEIKVATEQSAGADNQWFIARGYTTLQRYLFETLASLKVASKAEKKRPKANPHPSSL